MQIIIGEEKSILLYGEGKDEKTLFQKIVELDNFKYHTKGFNIHTGHATGGYPTKVLERCKKRASLASYDIIICFIDIDLVKIRHKKKWEKEKLRIEKIAKKKCIIIKWQRDKLEDELEKAFRMIAPGKKISDDKLISIMKDVGSNKDKREKFKRKAALNTQSYIRIL